MNRNMYFSLVSFTAVIFLHQAFSNDPVGGCEAKSEKWLDLGGDFCYIIESNDRGTWMEAVNKCHNEGGTLASFHSDEEVQRVVTYGSSIEVGFYIGLWKNHENSLKWVDKSPLDYENWFPGEPNFNFERCIEMYMDSGKWNDRKCDEQFGYICSSPKVLPPTGPIKGCLGKWEDLGGDSCYIIETDKIYSRRGASRRCSEKGGHLASFHSVEEISAVLKRTGNHDKDLYIGLQLFGGGTYIWDDSSSLDFTYLKSGDNDDRWMNHLLVCFLMNQQHGKWYKTECTKRAGYICSSPKVVVEKELEPLLLTMKDTVGEIFRNAKRPH